MKIRLGDLRRLIREACKQEEYWGRGGAGVMFTCSEDNTILLLKRAGWVAQGGTWGIPGGGLEDGWYETPIKKPIKAITRFRTAAFREVEEECGSLPPDFNMGQIVGQTEYEDCGFRYITMIADITLEQKTAWQLVSNDGETEEFKWFSRQRLPSKLHFGVKYSLANA